VHLIHPVLKLRNLEIKLLVLHLHIGERIPHPSVGTHLALLMMYTHHRGVEPLLIQLIIEVDEVLVLLLFDVRESIGEVHLPFNEGNDLLRYR
jgi:hypothetical protein